jgi:DNA-binding MarR family transcriptional regulator
MPGPTASPTAPAAGAPPTLPSVAVDAGLGLLCLIRSELRERRPAGLSMAQFRLLHMVHRDPERSLADIADDLGVSAPAVTKMLDVLVERGLVRRNASENDRRRVDLALTPDGRDVMRQVRKALEARVAERLAGLAPTEAAALAEALAVLRTRLDATEVLA